MNTQVRISTMVYKIVLVSSFVVCILLLPTITNAQTEDQSNLLDSIEALFNEKFGALSKEVQSLRSEVQTLRTELRQVQPGGGSSAVSPPSLPALQPARLTTVLRSGDTGEEVRRLQEILIGLGFNIPAGITGNFFSQTESVLKELQGEHDLPATGVLDQATRNLLERLLNIQPTYSPPQVGEPNIPFPGQENPIITPSLVLTSPVGGLFLNGGQKIPITWKTQYAPAGAKISFHLINEYTGVNQPVFETEDISGSYDWTTPKNMPGGNEFIAELIYKTDESSSPVVLARRTVMISLTGTTETTNTSTSNTSATSSTSLDSDYAKYLAFYKGTEFVTCMAGFPETVTLIAGWLDQGLLRYQFPWNEITGAAADKVAECEGGEFYDDDIPYYGDCTNNESESACFAQPGCKWFDTFCSGDDYDPVTGGGQCTGTTEKSCTSVENCYWYEGSSPAEEMYSCFYPNATIDGEAPGYTVWCEYDYQNCHVGDPSGADVSLDGLTLGAPSSCESGWGTPSGDSSYCYYDSDSTSSSDSGSFLANVVSAFSRALDSLMGIFGR